MGELKEYRVFGPPGTGKTTYVAGQVDKAARALGSDALMVASFTRTAASELSSRKMPLGRSQIGTLHSFAYRALDRPELVYEHIALWNKEKPHLKMSGAKQDVDHASVDQNPETQGDDLLNQLDICRGKMLSRERWPASVRAFEKAWTAWKRSEGVFDFTDLIEMSLSEGAAPGRPRIGFFDEVQDFTPLELSLVRSWGSHMDRVLLAGDDDQAIFTFKGATPDAFLDPALPDNQVRVLDQSYRLPHAVHAMSVSWIAQLSRRQPKDYKPRDEEGRIDMLRATWKAPENALADAEKRISQGQTVMFLTTCSYMLEPVKAVLRKSGMPFHNPYRRSRGDWNPLLLRDDVVTASDRLLSFLRPQEDVWGDEADVWSWQDVWRWADLLSSKGVLKHGAKSKLRRMASDHDTGFLPADLSHLNEMFAGDGLHRAWDGDLDWFESSMLPRHRSSLKFPVHVLRARGAESLMGEPKTMIGTVHSVKGGQADVVYLFPDLSPAASRDWMGSSTERDSVIRQMYVGITRARQHLVVCAPASKMNVDMSRHIRRAR